MFFPPIFIHTRTGASKMVVFDFRGEISVVLVYNSCCFYQSSRINTICAEMIHYGGLFMGEGRMEHGVNRWIRVASAVLCTLCWYCGEEGAELQEVLSLPVGLRPYHHLW